MSVYQDVVNLAKPYLGPASEQFVARQCVTHLKIKPDDLAKAHLAELAKWIQVGSGLIMGEAKGAELARKVASV
jgi:hypothetical protein